MSSEDPELLEGQPPGVHILQCKSRVKHRTGKSLPHPLPFCLFPLDLSKQLDFIRNNCQHSLIGSFGTRKGKGKKNPGMGIVELKGSFILEMKKLRPEADEPGQRHTPRAKKSPETGLSSPHSSALGAHSSALHSSCPTGFSLFSDPLPSSFRDLEYTTPLICITPPHYPWLHLGYT